MTNVFISYSRLNSDRAEEIRNFLLRSGISRVFLDVDPDQGILVGARWREVLTHEIENSRAVVLVISEPWLNSKNCREEYDIALKSGRNLVPLLIEGTTNRQIGTHRGFEALNDFNGLKWLAADDSESHRKACRSLLFSLKMAGVMPDSFVYDKSRPPFPGLSALTEDDAAVFFGRDGKVAELMARLRGTRGGLPRESGESEPQPPCGMFAIILGASGSGKSSFLRAGLVARLKWERDDFYCLPVVRPRDAVLSDPESGLTESLRRAAEDLRLDERIPIAGNPRAWANAALESPEAFASALELLRAAGTRGIRQDGPPLPVSLVLPLDQAEELFANPVDLEANRFCSLIAEFYARANVPLILLASMRSDRFPELQDHPALGPLRKETYDLPALPAAAFQSVIEGPANVAGVDLDPDLVDALVKDASGQDTLPLLAFVLGQLWERRLDGSKRIGRKDYEALGSLGGAISQAVASALEPDYPLDDPSVHDRLKRAFIPHLAMVDKSDGAFLRRIALRGGLPGDSSELIQRLIDRARIVVTRSTAEGGSEIEVAHESVLRQWPLLRDWLEDARGALWYLNMAEEAGYQWDQQRKALVEAGDEAALVRHDRDLLWSQNRLDEVWRALADVGQDRHRTEEPLRSFIRPEFQRLLRELESKASTEVGHLRRLQIGDRLADLGDCRPGISVLSPDSPHFQSEVDYGETRAAVLGSWQNAFKGGAQPLPDLVWCRVPAGKVGLYPDFNTQTGELGNPVWHEIEQPFYITQYPVTLSQYRLFAGSGTQRPEVYKNDEWWHSFGEEKNKWFHHEARDQSTPDNYPAQYVTWYQGIAFCRWLTVLYRSFGLLPESSRIRLPTEWEWVMAATGGYPDHHYPWGAGWDVTAASSQIGINRFVAAGLYPNSASPCKVMDMSGNLYEWCLNAFDDRNDLFEAGDAARTTKGGSWYTTPRAGKAEHALSVHARLRDNPDGKLPGGNGIAAGIRLVCSELNTDHEGLTVIDASPALGKVVPRDS